MSEPNRSKGINCLPLIDEERDDPKESDQVQLTLKVKAGSGIKAPVYRIKIPRFYSGTVAEWIDVLDALEEVWEQNTLEKASDIEASIKMILRDDALTTYEASVQDQVASGEPHSQEVITKALEEVSKQVFPHRALENQRYWMRSKITKPRAMTVRKLFSCLTRMNSKLIRFPGADYDDSFTAQQILEIVEFALPKSWAAKFDLQGYIPSLHDKQRLIQECEAMERSEAVKPPAKAAVPKTNNQKGRNNNSNNSHNSNNSSSKKENKYYCTEHGNNPTHNTASCFTIKNRKANENGGTPNGKKFSGNKFRNEIHTLSKTNPKGKRKVLDLYAAVIKTERAKVQKAKKRKIAKAAKAAESSEDEYSSAEEDEQEINAVEMHEDDEDEKEFNSRIRDLGLNSK